MAVTDAIMITPKISIFSRPAASAPVIPSAVIPMIYKILSNIHVPKCGYNWFHSTLKFNEFLA